MVIEIPPSEYTYDENMINEINAEERVDDSNADTIKSADQSEPHADLDNSDDSDICILESEIATANEQVVKDKESQETEGQNVDVRDHDATTEDWTGYMINDQSDKLSNHPDLKRLIMEVIFGSADTCATTKQIDTNKPALETSNDAKEHTNVNDNKSSSASVDNSKEASCSILETLKYHRPMRNRIRPLNDDFIYDLEEIASRKESALSHDSAPLRKKVKLNK